MAEKTVEQFAADAMALMGLAHSCFMQCSERFEAAGRNPGDMMMLSAYIVAAMARASGRSVDAVLAVVAGMSEVLASDDGAPPQLDVAREATARAAAARRGGPGS